MSWCPCPSKAGGHSRLPAHDGCPCPSGAGGQPPFLAPDAGCPILRASEGWGIPLGPPAYLPRQSPRASPWPMAKGLSVDDVPFPSRGCPNVGCPCPSRAGGHSRLPAHDGCPCPSGAGEHPPPTPVPKTRKKLSPQRGRTSPPAGTSPRHRRTATGQDEQHRV